MRLLFPLILAACAPTDDGAAGTDSAVDATDLRFALPEVGEDDLGWVTDEMVVPAYTEMQTCFVDTYTGPDIGAQAISTYQADGFGHHLLFWTGEVDPLVYPDGSSFDCLDPSTMSGWLPLFIVSPDRSEGGAVIASADLPDGFATLLRSGTRLILQSHYLNPTADALRVQDAVVFQTVPEADVQTWAAAWGHGITDMPLPAGEETTYSFDCDWSEDVHILNIFGHMHEHGTALSVDHHSAGSTTRIYDIPVWDPEYRDTPPVEQPAMPGLPVKAGDRFTTSCSFFNTKDAELDYPYEMCASTGMMYPSRVPVFCNPRPVR